MDPMWMAMSKLRRGRVEECIKICDGVLGEHPNDQVLIYIYSNSYCIKFYVVLVCVDCQVSCRHSAELYR